MSAIIIPFPSAVRPPRAAIEDTIERLITLLDTEDETVVDLEPEDDEDSDEGEAQAWPEWSVRSARVGAVSKRFRHDRVRAGRPVKS